MSKLPVAVLKFGSSILASDDDFPTAVHEVYRYVRAGYRVVAVVSALGKTTDLLVKRARRLTESPDAAGLAALLATGEATSAALFALALQKAGISAAVADPIRVGLRTTGPLLDAEPSTLDADAIPRLLERDSVVVLPGFYGHDTKGALSLLGRGGSDLTALFVAHRLDAEICRLLKNVDGVYESDPADAGGDARRYTSISWENALRLKARVVQPKALWFAQRHELSFQVSSPGASGATAVGPGRHGKRRSRRQQSR